MENEVPRKNDTEEREKGENSINIGVKCLNIASFWDCKWMSEVMGGGEDQNAQYVYPCFRNWLFHFSF